MGKSLIFVLVFVLLLSLLAGCKENECKVDDDCSVGNDCVAARCYKGSCQRQLIDDCCDPLDCSGKVVYPNPANPKRTVTAQYAEKFCLDGECVVGVQEPKQVQLFSEHPGIVAFELVAAVDQPFVIGQGSLALTLTLADYRPANALLPVVVDGVQVLIGSELVGQVNINQSLSAVGQSTSASLSLSPSLQGLEEELYVRLRVTYHYEAPLSSGGSRTERESFEATYNKQVAFVDPSWVE